MSVHQQNPDSLMKQLYEVPQDKKRGKLRIYFGYAAGLGKTCAMLNDANEALNSGIDVVAGYIEPHMRPETLALIKDIECIPMREISYKGITLKEFDLDRTLARKPELVLVDEMAHTNAEGCRHRKRYQDIEELLRAGINVYTTVNVQHIESLNDAVASITGISVRERIPDSVFDEADEIELVDIEPDDLIERLHKGKVYREKQAQNALENFFTKEKLTALRETALRHTADKVNRTAGQNISQNNSLGSEAYPYIKEHILVCLSSAPSNAKVIRTAARMADAFHGSFTALFVETPETKELDDKNKSILRENLRLAEQLGAQISTVYGEDVPEQIAEYAKVSRISKIVIGRSSRGKKIFKKSNFVDRITELAPNLDIYIIPDKQPSNQTYSLKNSGLPMLSWVDTGKALGLLGLCTLIGFWFQSLGFKESNIITVYILGILLTSMFTKGYIYGATSSILSVLVFNYFFTNPKFTLEAYDSGYPVTFFIMLCAALITSTLTKTVNEQARQSAQKAYRTEILLETSRKLKATENQEDILKETAFQLIKLLNRTVIIYTPVQNTLSEPIVFSKDEDSQISATIYTIKEERAVAEWVYKNNRRAGATTNTLSSAKCLYLAVRGDNNTVLAVVGLAVDNDNPLGTFEKNLMIAMLGECALALEKKIIDDVSKQISLQVQQERLRANLLRAISHDLRTPLTSISGNAGILMGNSKVLDEDQKKELYTDIYDDSVWLINLVENLLSITRIEDHKINITMYPELIEEVISEALNHISRKSAAYEISTELSDELLMANMDSRLIIQVIINIVDNAIKYTPEGSHIIISATRENKYIIIEISDDGNGINEDEKKKIFDMFYTSDNVRGDGRRGMGLGLFLCKSIVNAHGGTIYVKDNVPHGTIFGFTLEAEEVNIDEQTDDFGSRG